MVLTHSLFAREWSIVRYKKMFRWCCSGAWRRYVALVIVANDNRINVQKVIAHEKQLPIDLLTTAFVLFYDDPRLQNFLKTQYKRRSSERTGVKKSDLRDLATYLNHVIAISYGKRSFRPTYFLAFTCGIVVTGRDRTPQCRMTVSTF